MSKKKGDNIKNNKIIQAKEKFLELKSEHEKIIFSREDKINVGDDGFGYGNFDTDIFFCFH